MERGIGKALEYSGLGIAIVFAMIIVLMIVVKIMTTIIRGAIATREKTAASHAVAGGTESTEKRNRHSICAAGHEKPEPS